VPCAAFLAEAGEEIPGGVPMPDSHGSLSDHLEQLLQVEKFPPPAGFATTAQVSDPAVDEQAAADPVAWWATQARERLQWDTPFSLVLDDSNPPF
jgi:acetyl-CoA synthetase